MPDFTVISSNRLELLADRLAEIVHEPLSSTLEAETIIVQSRGMERWVSMALAHRNKICANVRYPFPNTFLENLYRRILPDLPELSPFNREVLTFRLLKILPSYLDRPHFSALQRYLSDDSSGLKAYQFSTKLADLYDQYLVFRPEMILQWDLRQGDGSADYRWQAELWRALASGKEKQHRAYLQREFQKRIESTPRAADDLPSRISLFGISYLPPFLLQSFIGLSRIVPVNLFLLSPCQEYWADILTRSQMARIANTSGHKTANEEFLHMEQGHPLLASIGHLGKEFFYLINQYDVRIEDCFEPVVGTDLLSQIQSDMLNLRDRTDPIYRRDDTVSPVTLEKSRQQPNSFTTDGSIQIHSCHNPMREIEILRDRLLDLFEADPELKPRDVIVMTPDIGAYAPYITAVFDSQDGDGPAIPYGIADQSTGRINPVVQSFLSLLDISNSRFSASRVLGLLSSVGIKERFGLTTAEVNIITHWVKDVNIRWGRDANSLNNRGLPGYIENTWQAGIDRLLLGYAMRGQDQVIFSGILPYDNIEGGEAQILGRFLEYLNRLFEWADRLGTTCSPADWQSLLTEMIDHFIAVNEKTERDILYLHSCLEAFGRLEKLADFSNPLALKVVRSHLEHHIHGSLEETGFLTGGVTFCAMLPMRSIPFKVVCLIGLDVDAFPRDDHPLGFDLIARHPRPGDRSRRKDDKYLFLEALVSARRNLYISYVGQSVQDNSHIPPSVLVSELIETIAAGYGVPENDLVIRHPLQAYSRRYFDSKNSALFSYSTENFKAACGAGVKSAPAPFFSAPLSMVPTEFNTLRLQDLCQFFTHPVRFLMRRRLRIHLEDNSQLLEDKENFNLDALDLYQMKQELLNVRLFGYDLSEYFPVQRAKGDLPQGPVGRVLYARLEQEAEHFAEGLTRILGDESIDDISIDMTVGKFKLLGSLNGLNRRGRIQYRFARRKAKDWLSAWINHLVLCALKDRRQSSDSILFDTDGAVIFKPVECPEKYLMDLLEAYQEGMQRPLHFFPELSFRYVQMVESDGKELEFTLKKIRNMWVGSEFEKGIADDPYHRLSFGGRDPIDEKFERLAEMVFIPIRMYAEELNL